MIRFACPRCRAVLEAPDKKAGAMIECARCDTRFIAAPKGQAEKERPASVNIGQEVGQNIGQAEGRAWLPGEGDLQPNRM